MLLAVIVSIVLVIAAIVAGAAIALWQQKNLQKSVRLEIHNEGNTQTRYELEAEDPAGALEFEFSLAGRGPTTGEAVAAPHTDQPAGATEPGEPTKAGRKWRVPAGPGAEVGEAKEKTKDAQAQAKKAKGFAGAIAEVLMSLGMLLPRSLGRPLLDVAGNIRRTQGRVETAERMPGRVSDQVSKMKKAVPKTDAPQVEMPQGEIAAPDVSLPKAPRPQATAPGPVGAEPTPPTPPAVPLLQTVSAGWVRTPPVEPGGKLQFDLLLRLRKPRKTQLYSFALISRAVGVDHVPPARQEWTVRIAGASGWRRYHPYLFIIGLTILTLLLTVGLAGLSLWG